jgi:hypothetical protein
MITFLFFQCINLQSQTDSLSPMSKNQVKAKSVNIGVGIYAHTEYYNKTIFGLYLTGSYITKISNNFNLGIGFDLFDNSTKDVNSIIFGIFLNPVFRVDALRNRLSFSTGGVALVFLRKDGANRNSIGGWFMFNVKSQYNINKVVSIGLEYKTLTIYPFLFNVYTSYNF